MGAAAYNRGSIAIRESLGAETRPVEFELMERFNSIPKHKEAATPFGPLCISPEPNKERGGFWILDAQKKWAGRGFWYPSIPKIMEDWNIEITEYTNGFWMCEIINTQPPP